MQLSYQSIVVLSVAGALITEGVKKALSRWDAWHDFIPLILSALLGAGAAAVAFLYGRFWLDGLMEGLIVAAGSVLGWSVVAKTIAGVKEILAALGG
jgi:hypothetical protein